MPQACQAIWIRQDDVDRAWLVAASGSKVMPDTEYAFAVGGDAFAVDGYAFAMGVYAFAVDGGAGGGDGGRAGRCPW